MIQIYIPYKKIPASDQFDKNILETGFIFNEFVFSFTDICESVPVFHVAVCIDTDNKRLNFAVRKGLKDLQYVFWYDLMRGPVFGAVNHDMQGPEEEEAAANVLSHVLDAIMYIMEQAYNKNVYYKKHPEDKPEADLSASNKATRNRKNKIYLLDDIIIYGASHSTDIITKHYKCPCWQVRGFYRHYKSGKAVWVKPFQKGWNRKKEKPKDSIYLADKHDPKGSGPEDK